MTKPIPMDDMTRDEQAAEAERLCALGYALEEADREEWRENPTVRRQLARRTRLGFADTYRFTTPEGVAFAYFAGGARGSSALISLRGEQARRAADVRAAAILASQV